MTVMIWSKQGEKLPRQETLWGLLQLEILFKLLQVPSGNKDIQIWLQQIQVMQPASVQTLYTINAISDREELMKTITLNWALQCSMLNKWAAGSLCRAYRKQEVAVCKERRFNVIGL